MGITLISILTKPVTKPYSKPRRGVKLSKQEISAENMHNSMIILEHAIKLEALKVAIVWRKYIEGIDFDMITRILDSFTSSKSASIRYIGLEMMARLTKETSNLNNFKNHLQSAITFLKNDDQEVRKQSAEVLYNLCDKNNWKVIIPELLVTLRHSNMSLQSDLVIRIASIAEKYASDTSWHIDTIFNLIDYAPDIMEDNIWYRIIWWLSGLKTEHYIQLQKYAVSRAFNILNEHKAGFSYTVPEPLQKLCGYLLGEFGYLLPYNDRNKAFKLIKGYFIAVSNDVKRIFLIALAKFAIDEKFKPAALTFLRDVSENDIDIEVQTRAYEMLKLLSADKEFYQNVLKNMPKYPSSLKKMFVKLPPYGKDICVVEPKRVTKTICDMVKEKMEFQEKETMDIPKPNEQLKDATNDERWKLFLSNEFSSGLYYSEKYITVSLSHLYKGHMGKVQIIVQNSDDSYTLNIFSITFQEVAGLIFSCNKYEPTTIKNGEKTSIKASFQAMQPFVGVPTCTIVAQVITPKKTKNLNVVFDLPILVTKLISPVQLKTSQFANSWNSIQNECIVNTKLKSKYDIVDSLIASISRWMDMHLTKTSDTIYASASMAIGMPDENRNHTMIPCFIMMKLIKSHVTLEVRSPDPMAAKSLAHAIKSVL